jgi:enolase
LHDRGLSTAVGEGGFAPNLAGGTEDAIILKAVEAAGYTLGMKL